MSRTLAQLWDRWTAPVKGFLDKWEKRAMWIAAISGVVAVLFLVSLEL